MNVQGSTVLLYGVLIDVVRARNTSSNVENPVYIETGRPKERLIY